MATINGSNGNDLLSGTALADLIYGKAGNDRIYGNAGNDYIDGGIGNDILSGGTGVDTLSYASAIAAVKINLSITSAQNTFGSGIDTFSGFENLIGSAFSDTLYGNAAGNTIRGGAGNDVIIGYAGNDTIEGGLGNDQLNGGVGLDTLTYSPSARAVKVSLAITTAQNTLGAGIDTITSFENLIGSSFNDTLTGNSAANTISGSAGNDLIDGGAGNDTLVGGAGIDTLSYASASSGVTVSLSKTTAQNTFGAGIDTVSTFENLIGTNFNDTLTGNSLANTITGGLGDDIIDGGAGNDILMGGMGTNTLSYASATAGVILNLAIATPQNTVGSGIDTVSDFENLHGSNFNDTLTGTINDNTIDGGAGNDIIDGNAGNDTLIGGADIDTVSYASAESGVNFNLTITTAQNTLGAGIDTVNGFENVTGSAFNDNLSGDAFDNVIDAGLGDDIVAGDAGNDTLDGGGGTNLLNYGLITSGVTVDLGILSPQNTGGAGIDTISNFQNLTGTSFDDILGGDSGNNTLIGGIGNDTVTYASATAGVHIALLTSGAQNTIGAGIDTLIGFENITGSAFNDSLVGDNSANVIQGSMGNDLINGGNGNDLVDGGADDDLMFGGSGTDTLSYASASSAIMFNLGILVAQDTIGAGIDTVQDFENVTGSDFDDIIGGDSNNNLLVGGLGNDTVSYQLASSAVTINLAITTAQNTIGAGVDTINGFENIYGSLLNDTLTGDDGDNFISGEAGNDTIQGGLGNDFLAGGQGNDIASYSSAASAVMIDLNITTAQDTGGAGIDTLNSIENVTGTFFNDLLVGDANANIIRGGSGNDTIIGGAGNDFLDGADGDDSINGGDGNDIVTGGLGHNLLIGGLGTDRLTYALAAGGVLVDLSITNEQNTIGAGSDTIDGFENITGSIFNDALLGDANNNALNGEAGDDLLLGGAGDDTLDGDANNDVVDGGSGDDVLLSSLGDDVLIGGGGNDTINFSVAANAITLNLANTSQQNTGVGLDTVSEVENIIGSAHNDILTGNSGNNDIQGLAGNDVIDGGAGDDILDGGLGIDTVSYASAASFVLISLAETNPQNTIGAGTDTLIGFENIIGSNSSDILRGNALANTINGGNGNDSIDGGLGDDILNGGTGGFDTLVYDSAVDFIRVSLGDTNPQNTNGSGIDTISGFENITGSIYNDILTGDSNSNIINGEEGNDTIDGGGGTDDLSGSDGVDTVSYASASAAVTVSLALQFQQQNTQGAGLNFLGGFENLTGSSFNDTLTGYSDDNDIKGGDGDDIIRGAGGNDELNGGAGRDTFVYTALSDGDPGEEINDFVIGTDILDLHDLLATFAGYNGSNAFSGGYLFFYTTIPQTSIPINDTIVVVDADGSAGAGGQTVMVTLENVHLTQADTSSYITPIIFDLDNSGNYDLLSVNQSQTYFDLDNNGQAEHLAWVGSNDGVLIYDANGDGKVTDSSEFAFSQYVEGAKTDLEGLRAFDSNQDGRFDAQDSKFDQFAVWQDRNENGQTDEGELLGLKQLGISAVNLVSDNQMQHLSDTIIFGQGTITYYDGQTGLLADAGFRFENMMGPDAWF